jgi:hypothetical protein
MLFSIFSQQLLSEKKRRRRESHNAGTVTFSLIYTISSYSILADNKSALV